MGRLILLMWRWVLDAVAPLPPLTLQALPDECTDLRIWDNAAELLADQFASAS